jgi:hypothetical protein
MIRAEPIHMLPGGTKPKALMPKPTLKGSFTWSKGCRKAASAIA